jgi:methyl-accepting chemotaxis protein
MLGSFLSNVGIRAKIMSVVALGVLGLAASAGVTFWSKATERQFQAVMDDADLAAGRLYKLDIALLEARRHEKDFQLRRQDQYVERQAKSVAEARSILGQLDGQFARTDLGARTTKIASGVEAYGRAFAELVEVQRRVGLNETAGLQGALRKAVQEVEQILKSASEDAVAVRMLMMRRHEKDFLARLDRRYAEQMKGEAEKFGATLATAASLQADQKAQVGRLMAAYQRDFAALVEGSLAVVEAGRKLSAAYAAVEPEIDALHHAVEARTQAAVAGLESARTQAQWMLIIGLSVVVLAVLAFGLLLSTTLSNAILRIVEAMRALAGGNKTVEIPGRGRGDEIGRMADALEVFKATAIEAERAQAEQERLKTEATAERRRATLAMADNFEQAVGGIVRTVASAATELRAAAETLSTTTEETSQQSAVVSTAAEEVTASVQTVAAATEELSASIGEIAQQAGQSSKYTTQAVGEAEATNARVQQLAEAARRIGDVVKLINDIAGQTNLLALNATIEAARAGEAGKGFAVVASEVKALATQTAKATDEIAGQVQEIQSATAESAHAIAEIGGTIRSINEITTGIAAAVDEQQAATQEISRNVQQAAQGTTEVSSNIVSVREAATSSGAAATQVLSSADDLSRQAENLRAQVDRFLSEVRAA